MIWLWIVLGIFIGSFTMTFAIVFAERNVSNIINATLARMDREIDCQYRDKK
jgi:hypothetical protein